MQKGTRKSKQTLNQIWHDINVGLQAATVHKFYCGNNRFNDTNVHTDHNNLGITMSLPTLLQEINCSMEHWMGKPMRPRIRS